MSTPWYMHYNCTRNDSMYELMFGRTPQLPVDLAFALPIGDKRHSSHSEYVKNLKTRLEESYRLASRNALKTAARNKVRYDQKVTRSDLGVGDRVLVRNVWLRGKQKLVDKWKADVYVVIDRAGHLPVYTVRPETKDGPNRTQFETYSFLVDSSLRQHPTRLFHPFLFADLKPGLMSVEPVLLI